MVACPLEPFPKCMDVRYHYRDVLVFVVCSNVAVGVVVSGGLSIVDIVFAVKFAM